MSIKICTEIDKIDDGGDEISLGTYVATVGNGSATQLSVPHNLGSSDVVYSLRDIATGALDSFDVDVNALNPNSLSLTFATAPSANSVRVTVLAVK